MSRSRGKGYGAAMRGQHEDAAKVRKSPRVKNPRRQPTGPAGPCIEVDVKRDRRIVHPPTKAKPENPKGGKMTNAEYRRWRKKVTASW